MTTITNVLPGLALGLAVLWAASYFYKLRTRKKISMLVRASSRLAKGEKFDFPSWSSDDWNTLAGSMAHLAQMLHNKILKAEREKEKLATLLNHMQEGVIGVDKNYQILIHNPSASRILSFPDLKTGRSLLECTRNPEIDEMIHWAVDNQQTVTKNIDLTYPQRKHVGISAAGTGVSETGICGLIVLYDLTEIRKLEKIRQEFVANVSHELRTPLTSIKGFIETLLSGALRDTAQSEKFLAIMQEDANRLSRLIDDLLDLSIMDSKTAVMKIEPLSLEEETRKVWSLLEPAAAKKNITIQLLFPPSLPAIRADRDRFKQVLVNLLDNAVKFNREGGKIIVSAGVKAPWIEITVKDTGIGIPPFDLPRIFERFYRVDKDRSKQSGGTGLGLSIVKHIIEAHGGHIACESTPGQGSLFRIQLPV